MKSTGRVASKDPHSRWQHDHAADAHFARSTMLSSAASVPGATRNSAPDSSISIRFMARAGADTCSGHNEGSTCAKIGTNAGSVGAMVA